MSSRPVVYFVFLFGLGILLAPYFPLPVGYSLLASLVALIVAGLFYLWWSRANRVLFLILFVLLGFITARLDIEAASTPLQQWAGSTVTVEGVVDRDPDVREDRVQYTLSVTRAWTGDRMLEEPGGRVLLTHYQPDVIYGYGDLLEGRGLLLRPADAGNPGGFDYRAYLERLGISLVLQVRGDDAVTKTGTGGNILVGAALWVKERLCQGIDWALEPQKAEIIKGITLGMRTGIDPAVKEAFTATGVVHILAVSGLHVGFLIGLTMLILNALRFRPAWSIAAVVVILLVYMVMVGFKPSVVRASTMAVMLLVAYEVGRMRDWPTAMAVAAFVILLANPLMIYDAGFQLSFAATWGILYLGPLMVKGLDALAERLRCTFWRTSFSWALAVPLGAQLGTLPLVAYYYNLVSPVALPANLVIIPIVGVLFILGLLTGVIAAVVPGLAWLTGSAVSALIDIFLRLVDSFAALPGAYYYVATPPVWLIGLCFLMLYAAGQYPAIGEWRERIGAAVEDGDRIRRRVLPVAAVVIVGAVFFWVFQPPERQLEVHFIDVGQGDAALIRTPSGKNLLIDTGGRFGEFEEPQSGVGKNVVVPYLRRLGVGRIDVLVLTHPHEDHIGGVRAVAEAFPVALAVIAPLDAAGGSASERSHYHSILTGLHARGVPISEASYGNRITVDSRVRIDVLGPVLPLLHGTQSDPNNNSLVLRLVYRDHVFLFTGDIEREAQARIVMSGVDLRADVLKVPHHGSGAFVPHFFEAVQPRWSVISVGSGNRFGLPNSSTLEKLESLNCRVFRTDRDGAVIFRSDGRRMEVETGRAAKQNAEPAA